MAQGPIEFFLLAFPGTQDQGGLVAALQRAQALKDVRIIDALVVAKSPDGTVDAAELSDVDALAHLATGLGLGQTIDDDSLIGMDAEDAEEIGAAMTPDTTALALLVEHVWATELADAIEDAGGGVVAAVRIPRERFDDDEFDDGDDSAELQLSVEPAMAAEGERPPRRT
jgi:uncharacterized membrane protein